ncbi:MAG TPA: DUF2934 domain-containing protein [bacterium]|nr:DUF2934 domain-containing protein [bacterium]
MSKIREKETHRKQQDEMARSKMEVAAYYRWLERGCPMGDELTDWVEVERKYASRHN